LLLNYYLEDGRPQDNMTLNTLCSLLV